MTKNRFNRLLESMERFQNLNKSDMDDFVETCRRLLVYQAYAELSGVETPKLLFDEKDKEEVC